jgi:spermidine synthase
MRNRSVPIPEDTLVEHVYPYMGQYVAVEKRLVSARTAHHEIELVWNGYLGNILVMDGIIQHTDRDEYVYAELLAHAPLCCVESATPRVLIVGGGDMGVMEEVLKHASVSRCDLVDIDGGMIEFAKQYMAHIHRDCWRDERAAVIVEDGLEFLQATQNRYDAILVDGTDPDYPDTGNSLFTDEFFEAARSRLSEGGMFVIGSDAPFHHPQAIAPIQRRLRRLYTGCGAFHGTVPTFQGGLTLFAYGMTRDLPVPVSSRLPEGLQYLNAPTLEACFALPENVRRLVELEEVPEYEWHAEDYARPGNFDKRRRTEG